MADKLSPEDLARVGRILDIFILSEVRLSQIHAEQSGRDCAAYAADRFRKFRDQFKWPQPKARQERMKPTPQEKPE